MSSGVWRPWWLYGIIMLPNLGTALSLGTDDGMDFLNYFMMSDSGPHFVGSRDDDFNFENIISQYLATEKLDCNFDFNACGWEWFSKNLTQGHAGPRDVRGPK